MLISKLDNKNGKKKKEKETKIRLNVLMNLDEKISKQEIYHINSNNIKKE